MSYLRCRKEDHMFRQRIGSWCLIIHRCHRVIPQYHSSYLGDYGDWVVRDPHNRFMWVAAIERRDTPFSFHICKMCNSLKSVLAEVYVRKKWLQMVWTRLSNECGAATFDVIFCIREQWLRHQRLDRFKLVCQHQLVAIHWCRVTNSRAIAAILLHFHPRYYERHDLPRI